MAAAAAVAALQAGAVPVPLQQLLQLVGWLQRLVALAGEGCSLCQV
jgi:hypothetical protein